MLLPCSARRLLVPRFPRSQDWGQEVLWIPRSEVGMSSPRGRFPAVGLRTGGSGGLLEAESDFQLDRAGSVLLSFSDGRESSGSGPIGSSFPVVDDQTKLIHQWPREQEWRVSF